MKEVGGRRSGILLAGVVAVVAAALGIGLLLWRGSEAVVPAPRAPRPPSLDESVSLTARASAFHEAAGLAPPPAQTPKRKRAELPRPPPVQPPSMPPPPRPPSPDQLANPVPRPLAPGAPAATETP
jgi:hypothetical protein